MAWAISGFSLGQYSEIRFYCGLLQEIFLVHNVKKIMWFKSTDFWDNNNIYKANAREYQVAFLLAALELYLRFMCEACGF